MSAQFTRRTLPRELAACELWPMPDLSQLGEAERLRFAEFRQTITCYLSGEKMAGALKAGHITHRALLRQLNRCVTQDSTGHLFGWHALLPYQRVKTYVRTAPIRSREVCAHGGYSGALGLLFARYPDIQEELDLYLLRRCQGRAVPESRVTPAAAHTYFLQLCRRKGMSSAVWPMCVASQGRTSLWRYVRRFFDLHFDEVVAAQFGETAQAKSRTGTGYRSRLQAVLPYDIVELDEHSGHFLGAIGIPTSKGMKWVPLRRLSIIPLADRDSGVVLTYGVIVRQEPTSQDILSIVARALKPWEPRKLATPGFKIESDGIMPSVLIQELAYCGFNMLLLDNHLAHLAAAVVTRLCDTAGCIVNYGPERRFERRALIEGIFHTLEENGFVRLPSTTGSNSQDSRRRDATRAALKHCMSLDAVLDLIEAAFADHNTHPTSHNFGSGPIAQLRSVVADTDLGFVPPWMPPQLPGEPALNLAIERGRIGGNRASGVRPHIYLDQVRYTNPTISSRWDLIDKVVIKHVNEDNIRSFTAWLETGQCLGSVTAMGKWGLAPHSRAMRKEINAMLASGKLEPQRGESPVTAMLKLLAHKATAQADKRRPKQTRAANVLAEEVRRGNLKADDLADDAPEAAAPAAPAAASDAARQQALTPLSDFVAIN